MSVMSKRDSYFFILNAMLPDIERDGLTIKTRRNGELTLFPTDPSVIEFTKHLRQSLIAALNRPVAPSSPYGIDQ